MIEMYKILTNKYDHRVTGFINTNCNDTRGHQYKIYKQHTRLDLRKYSFVHRSVNHWNNLPEDVVNAPTVKSFERRLDKLWSKNQGKFNPEFDIPITRSRMRTARLQDDDADLTLEAASLLSEEDL